MHCTNLQVQINVDQSDKLVQKIKKKYLDIILVQIYIYIHIYMYICARFQHDAINYLYIDTALNNSYFLIA